MCGRRNHHFFWWPIGLVVMFMMFGLGIKLLAFMWPLIFFMPFLFWFSRSRHSWRYRYWSDNWSDNDEQWEKPKRKNDEFSTGEKLKREGQSEIYYF